MDDGSKRRKRGVAYLLTLPSDYFHKHNEVGEVDSVPLRFLCNSLKKMSIAVILIRRSKREIQFFFYISGYLAVSYNDIQLILSFK